MWSNDQVLCLISIYQRHGVISEANGGVSPSNLLQPPRSPGNSNHVKLWQNTQSVVIEGNLPTHMTVGIMAKGKSANKFNCNTVTLTEIFLNVMK